MPFHSLAAAEVRSSAPSCGTASVPVATVTTALRLPSVEGGALHITYLSSVDGLSQTRVAQIVQDDRGFMWFGTQYGLNRYDGYQFRLFVHDPHRRDSLAGTFITALFKDRTGTLWVATNEALDRYDPTTESFTHFVIDAGADSNIPTTVIHIAQDNSGALWLSSGTGLHRLDPRTGAVTHFRHSVAVPCGLPSDDVTWSGQDRRGRLWVGTNEGLDEFDPRDGKVLLHIPIPDNVQVSFFEDKSGTFWIVHASGTGLAIFDPASMTVRPLSFYDHEPQPGALTGVMGVVEDDDGQLWFGSPGGGLMRFDAAQQQFIRHRNHGRSGSGAAEDHVIALYKDREGNIWTGYHSIGPGHFAAHDMGFKVFKHEAEDPGSLDVDFVNAIYEDSNRHLWIGNDVGLNLIDEAARTKELWTFGLGEKPMIISLTAEPSGIIWFGTFSNGLGRFDTKSGAFKIYRHDPAQPSSLSNDEVHRILVDHAGNLWAATDDGLDRLDRTTDRFTTYKVDWRSRRSQSYISIAEDSNGILWLGTHYSGLHRFDPASGQFRVYLPKPGNLNALRDAGVPTVLVSHSGMVWAGTKNGLNSLDPQSGVFRAFDVDNGLAGNAISCILEDSAGFLWLSTNQGISRFNPVTGRFENYSAADGLPGNDLSGWSACARGPDGRMFFGGFPGAVGFFPKELKEDHFVPPIVFTDFQLSGRTVRPGEKPPLPHSITVTHDITLSHDQSMFSITFSGLGYVSPATNRYRYRLDGLDSDWTEVKSDQRRAVYTTLPPGSYTFRVQGATMRGPWNAPGASLGIEILPPWWATWWFRTLYVGALGLVLWITYQFRLQAASRRLVVQMEASQAERSRISHELHDTLLQGLLSASLQLAVAKGKIAESAPGKSHVVRVHDLIQQLVEETRRAVRGIRGLRSRTDDLETAFAEIPKDLAVFGQAEFRFVVDGPARPVRAHVRDEVYRIGREALANAFRHSKADHVEVVIEYAPTGLRVVIRDDGCGIDPEILRDGRVGHWGLSGMRERAERVGAAVDVSSRLNAGTEVAIFVPGRRAFEPGKNSTLKVWLARLYSGERGRQ